MAPLFVCCFKSSEQCSKRWDVLVEVLLQLLAVLCAFTSDLANEHVTTAIHGRIDKRLRLVPGSQPSSLLVVRMDVTFQDLLGELTTVVQVVGKAP